MRLTVFELNNYWLPLLWVLAAGLVLSRMPKKTMLHGDRVVRQWYLFSAILLVLPLILWAGARVSFGDTAAYRRAFQIAPVSFGDLPLYMEQHKSDWAFYLLIGLVRCLGIQDPSVFFMFISIVQMLCLVYTFRHYSENFWLCIFLFVASTDYFSWMFNGMRQFLAVTLIFAAFGLLVRKKYALYALVVICAAQFHGSAMLMLPLAMIMQGPAMNRKTFMMILGVAVVVPFIDQFMPILDTLLADTQYGNYTSDEVWSVDDGTSMFRVLVYSVPALVALFGYRHVRNCTDPVMNMCINASIITMAIYLVSSVTSGIYVGRLPVYTTFQGYMALPWLIDRIFEKTTAHLIKLMMILCYAAFYYFQMGITWGLI